MSPQPKTLSGLAAVSVSLGGGLIALAIGSLAGIGALGCAPVDGTVDRGSESSPPIARIPAAAYDGLGPGADAVSALGAFHAGFRASAVPKPSDAPTGSGARPPDHPLTLSDTVPATQSVQEVCRRVAAKLASVSLEDCLESRLELSAGTSVRGLPILTRTYPPIAAREPRGRVLLVGGIHGDEFSSVSIVFKWLRVLDQFHSGLFHWRVVPILNPDGLLGDPSQRMNANGVDLNRNFPTPNWQEESRDYWERRTSHNPRRYPGPAALSEPETRWLSEEIERFRPDVIVAVHAPYHVLDFDGPPHAPERLGPLKLKLLGTYPGSLGRYAGVHKSLAVVTIELPSAGIMPTVDEQMLIWKDLVTWLKQRLPGKDERIADSVDRETVAMVGSGN